MAIPERFGELSPPRAASIPLEPFEWLVWPGRMWGPYGSMAGDFEKETFTYRTGIQPKVGWEGSCTSASVGEGRPWSSTKELDVYKPATREDGTLAPIIFTIHGGAWVTEERDVNFYSMAYFLERGYGVVSPSYSFNCDGYSVYDMLDELTAALDFVRANASAWGFDDQRIFLTGFSAGAHLALMLGYTLDSPACGNWTACGIRGVLSLYGVTTPNLSFVVGGLVDMEALANTSDKEAAKQAFPAYRVTSSSPPTITIHGTWDVLVPYSDATTLHDELEKAGVQQLLISLSMHGHTLDYCYHTAAAQIHRYAFERMLVM